MAKLNQSSPKVAIVAALEREIGPLIRKWRVSEREHAGRRFRFFETQNAVLVCGGMGAEAARRASEAVIALYAPDIVYSAGFAGALGPELKVGDLIEAQRVINASDGSSITRDESRVLPSGAELRSAGQPLRRASLAQGRLEAAVPAWVLVSFGLVASPEQKAKLRESFAAHAVDMEAAAVARAAAARGVAFAAVKVISDDSEFNFPPLERFVDSRGRFREARFALFAALRPWLWPQVARLARDSRNASRVLCSRLQSVIREGA